MLSGRGRRAGAERRRTAPPAPALLADMALPGRLAVLFSRDMPGVRGVNPSLGCTIVGTRSVRLRWAVAAPPRPPSSPGSTVQYHVTAQAPVIPWQHSTVSCHRPDPRHPLAAQYSIMSPGSPLTTLNCPVGLNY